MIPFVIDNKQSPLTDLPNRPQDRSRYWLLHVVTAERRRVSRMVSHNRA